MAVSKRVGSKRAVKKQVVRKRTVQLEDLFKLETPLHPALAPDGESLVYVQRRMNLAENRYEADLWWLSWDGSKKRQLTRGAARHLSPAWHPRGRHIAYVAIEPQQSPQVWILPLEGGEPWPLTSLGGGPVRDLCWSPDGKWLLFGHRSEPRIPEEERQRRPAYKHITQLHHKLDGDGFYPAERWHLFRVAFAPGRPGRTHRAEQLTKGPQDDQDGRFSPDGRHIVFVSNRMPDADLHPDNSDLFVITAGGRGLRQITKRFGPIATPAWSLDGSGLYYIGHFGGEGEWLRHPQHIYHIEISSGRTRDLTPKLDNWPFNRIAADTVPGGANLLHVYRDPTAGQSERVAFLVNEEGAVRLYSISGGHARKRVTPRLESPGRINVYAAHGTSESIRMVIAASHMADAGDLYRIALDGSGELGRLTHINRRVMSRWQVQEPEEVIFGGRRNQNVPVHGWILKPPGFRRNRRYPMVLNIHGGPMAQYGYSFFHEMHLLASQGYVVVFTNPRGSSGYGLKYMNCIENNWGKLDYDDLMAVVDEMVRKPYVDGRRLGVLGGSYGGFMATWIVGHTQRFRAAVTQRQVGNVITQVGSSDLGFYRVLARGAFPWETPMRYLRDSANFHAHRIKTPLLIIHSEQDLRCPIAQGEELFTLLKLQGRTTEMIRFEKESHGLSRGGRPQNRRERLRRIVDWFDRHL